MFSDDKDMQESLFENVYILTEEIAKDYSRAQFRNYFIAAYIVSPVILLSGILWARSILMVIIGVCLPMLLHIFVDSIARQIWTGWSSIQNVMEIEGNLKNKIMFFEDKITSINLLNEEKTFRYKSISKVVEGKICLHISLGKAFDFIIKKDAFTKGDYETFVTFFRGKWERRNTIRYSL